jgi:hypothetical protein
MIPKRPAPRNNVEALNEIAWRREQERLKRELMAFAVEEKKPVEDDDTDPSLAWAFTTSS